MVQIDAERRNDTRGSARMKFGYASANSAQGILPGTLARELEARGFDSLWVPEHSHMPVASVGTYPDPRSGLPSGYAHMMSPFVSLMAAAAATTRLKICTGISLALEHDLLDLACTTATLDVLSDARLLLGFGVGWNAEELANHRPGLPFARRYSALAERVAALRAAWSHREAPYTGLHDDQAWTREISSFDGAYERYTPSWVFPKPKAGTIPVGLGLTGPVGIRQAASHADFWAPVDQALFHQGRPDVAGCVAQFRALVTEAGRDPARVPITLFAWAGESDPLMARYAELGVERVVFAPPTMDLHPPAEDLRRLDLLQRYIGRH
jgi:alkanesulfonate monooxygenase SsuD/methylene tetrahydromethanopterin reductase-like flavin-dependent oxidoreductase (luciferase family)